MGLVPWVQALCEFVRLRVEHASVSRCNHQLWNKKTAVLMLPPIPRSAIGSRWHTMPGLCLSSQREGTCIDAVTEGPEWTG